MSNKNASISSFVHQIFPTVSIRSRSIVSQFLITITVYTILIALLPCVTASPTPTLVPVENNNNNEKIITDSNAFMYGSNDNPKDSSFPSSSVHDQPLLTSSSFFYDQPRSHANQFLMSNVNDNQIIVPKWFTRFNNNADDEDDIDDYIPSGLVINKRSSFYNHASYQTLKKRKQLTKPPMEVMNEIVNSIYLKR